MSVEYRVTKVIDFCYGHRLLAYIGKCQHLHGHNGRIEIDIKSSELDDLGMVVDFGKIKELIKGWVDENLDHRMILCRRDPIVSMLKDMNEPMYLMDENPTAENIAKHIFEYAVDCGFDVVEIRLWETPTSCVSYRRH